MEPVPIHTIRDYLTHGYTVTAWCWLCRRHAPVNLERLIAKGLGNKAGCDLRLRCAHCHRKVTVTLSAPVGAKT